MDKYDEQIEYLTENPELIWKYWEKGIGLFQFVSDTGKEVCPSKNEWCGCLTMIRNGTGVSPTESLTKEIRADERIPQHPHDITVEDLPVFAEWQRRLDEELGRE